MCDVFLDGVPILDCLEITGSTATTARWVNCDQSSVSRAYRRVSDELGLGFCKQQGHYRATTNLALLASLRQAAQLRRLSLGGRELQWVSHPSLPPNLALLGHRGPLPRSWRDDQRSFDLLRQRVLDLAVICRTSAPVDDEAGGLALLPCGSDPDLCLVALRELREHPSLRELCQQIGSSASLESHHQVGTALR